MLTETQRFELVNMAHRLKAIAVEADDAKVINAYKAVVKCVTASGPIIDVAYTAINPYEPGTVNMNKNWKPVS